MFFPLVITRDDCDEGCFSVKPKTNSLTSCNEASGLYLIIWWIILLKHMFLYETMEFIELNYFGENIEKIISKWSIFKSLSGWPLLVACEYK